MGTLARDSGDIRQMPESKTYAGGCHCGRVRYEVATDLATVMECNCSHCSKRGMLSTFVTPHKFTALAGGDGLKDYHRVFQLTAAHAE